MRTLAAIPLLALLLPTFASATSKWDEAAIVKAVGQRVISKQKESDDYPPGCTVTRYFFKKSPDAVLEFRCNRVNVAWDQFKEKGFEQKNKEVVALAIKAAAALSQGTGREVGDVAQGNVVKNRSLTSGLTVGGSCQMSSCLLTYR